MGPIEVLFLILVGVFVIIGLVRGYARELGVTTMLLVVLFVIELVNERYQDLVNQALNVLTGQETVDPARAWLFIIILIVVAFISYEGQTLSFPGKGKRPAFDAGTGLLNGYLLVGSIWYYLHQAGWTGFPIVREFTPFYEALVRLLPPAVFSWPYFIGLAVVLLIARVWR